MKWLLILAALGALAYVYFDDELNDRWLGGMPLNRSDTTVLYKWRDAQGRWQVSDQRPAPGTKFEILEYRHDDNVIPGNVQQP